MSVVCFVVVVSAFFSCRHMGNLVGEEAQPKWLWKEGDTWSPTFFTDKKIEFDGDGERTARWGIPLKQLPNAYFEITVVSTTDRTCIFVGACPKAHGETFLGAETNGGCWIFYGPLEGYQQGDTIGWGITKDSRLFRTFNGKLSDEGPLPNEFYPLYPFLSVSRASKCCLEINIDATNPSGAGPYVAGPDSNKKSFELMSRTLGQMDYSTLVPSDAPLCQLPLDIVLFIQRMLGPVCPILLSTCKTLNQTLHPTFQWVDYHGIRDRIPGYYTHTLFQKGDNDFRPCFTVAYELKADGTFSGVSRTCPPGVEMFVKRQVQGVWSLGHFQITDSDIKYGQRVTAKSRNFSVIDPTSEAGIQRGTLIQFSSEDGFILRYIQVNPRFFPGFKYSNRYQHTRRQVSQKDFEDNYLKEGRSITPSREGFERICGIPPNQQKTGKGCCHEVVEELMESVWGQSDEHLGGEAKQGIISRISLRCMEHEGGMSETGIKLAIAQEVAELGRVPGFN